MRKLFFLVTVLFLFNGCEEITTKEQVKSDKENLESGDANSPLAYNDGLTAEMATLQAKYITIDKYIANGGEIQSPDCLTLVDKLIDECEKTEKIYKKIIPIGIGGDKMKSLAFEHLYAVRELGNSIKNVDGYAYDEAATKIDNIISEFTEIQKKFIRKNGLREGEVIDPEELE
jgi:hypothetical protein